MIQFLEQESCHGWMGKGATLFTLPSSDLAAELVSHVLQGIGFCFLVKNKVGA